MANGVFNISKGKVARQAELPFTNDALIVVLLQAAGLVSDAVMADYATLAAVLAANTEANFTNYTRKTITTGITVTTDTVADKTWVDLGDIVWTAAGGATNNTLGKLLICYDADTTSGTDASIIPLTYHDFAVTTNGLDLTAQIAATGIYQAT